jgi:ribosome-binding factor A
MSSRRLLKAAEAIRSVVGMAILADLKDPRIRDVTVTHVEVAPDMRNAKVHVSIMGDETRQNLSLRGLQSAAGFLQSKIAKQIDTRYTPRLTFVLDLGVKKSIEMARILREVLPPESGDAPISEDEAAEGSETEIDENFGDGYNEEAASEELEEDEGEDEKRSKHPR